MDSFLLACSVVFPLFVYMLIGCIVRKLGMYSYDNFKALNGLIFKLLIPLALFCDVYKADVGDAFQPKIFLFVFICILTVWTVCWFLFSAALPELPDQATMIQGVFRSNYVLFGTTIGAAICSSSGMALVAALAAMTVPEFNILSVLTFEMKRGRKVPLRQLIISIFKNPLVDSALIAVLVHMIRLPIPELILTPLSKLASTASPLALVSLGGMLSMGSIRSHVKLLISATAGRLVLIPLAVVCLAVLLGIRGDALVAILAIFASPTAIASTPMAYAMGGNGPLAGEIVAVTSAVSVITIFFFVYFLSAGGFF